LLILVSIRRFIEDATSKIRLFAQEHAADPKLNEMLLEELRKVRASMGLPSEFRYWILICGLFTCEPSRNIVKYWKVHEKTFLQLVQEDGKIGIKQLLQAIVLFFVRRHPDGAKYIGTFMKLLYDQAVFDEEFIIKWFNKKAKLDKTCALYDRKAEKAFRGQIGDFVTWLM